MDQESFLEAVRLEALNVLNQILDVEDPLRVSAAKNIQTKALHTPSLVFLHDDDYKSEVTIFVCNPRGRWFISSCLPGEEGDLSRIFTLPRGSELMPEAHAIKILGLQFALAIYELDSYFRDNAVHPSWWFGEFFSTLEKD